MRNHRATALPTQFSSLTNKEGCDVFSKSEIAKLAEARVTSPQQLMIAYYTSGGAKKLAAGSGISEEDLEMALNQIESKYGSSCMLLKQQARLMSEPQQHR